MIVNNRYAVEKIVRLGWSYDDEGVSRWHWAGGDNIKVGKYRYIKCKDRLDMMIICPFRSNDKRAFTMPRGVWYEPSIKYTKSANRNDYLWLNHTC